MNKKITKRKEKKSWVFLVIHRFLLPFNQNHRVPCSHVPMFMFSSRGPPFVDQPEGRLSHLLAYYEAPMIASATLRHPIVRVGLDINDDIYLVTRDMAPVKRRKRKEEITNNRALSK